MNSVRGEALTAWPRGSGTEVLRPPGRDGTVSPRSSGRVETLEGARGEFRGWSARVATWMTSRVRPGHVRAWAGGTGLLNGGLSRCSGVSTCLQQLQDGWVKPVPTRRVDEALPVGSDQQRAGVPGGAAPGAEPPDHVRTRRFLIFSQAGERRPGDRGSRAAFDHGALSPSRISPRARPSPPPENDAGRARAGRPGPVPPGSPAAAVGLADQRLLSDTRCRRPGTSPGRGH